MATMIPGDIGKFETEGEKAFYKFLEGVAKPDAHYLCWRPGSGRVLIFTLKNKRTAPETARTISQTADRRNQ